MWIDEQLRKIDRKKAEIWFDPHMVERQLGRVMEIEKIKHTIRYGRIYTQKCEKPNKICFSHYFGKENETYIVVARLKPNFIKVITCWKERGRI